jgi:hypothetical protein
MKRKRHSPEQVIRQLRTADQLLKGTSKNKRFPVLLRT